MTVTFRAASQIELTQMQIQLAKMYLRSTVYTELIQGNNAIVSAFTRANLIVSHGEFKDKFEAEEWEKIKLDAHKVMGYYVTRLSLPPQEATPTPTKIGSAPPAAKLSIANQIKAQRKKPENLTEDEKQKMIDMYIGGASMSKIATTLKRSITSVQRTLNKATKS